MAKELYDNGLFCDGNCGAEFEIRCRRKMGDDELLQFAESLGYQIVNRKKCEIYCKDCQKTARRISRAGASR